MLPASCSRSERRIIARRATHHQGALRHPAAPPDTEPPPQLPALHAAPKRRRRRADGSKGKQRAGQFTASVGPRGPSTRVGLKLVNAGAGRAAEARSRGTTRARRAGTLPLWVLGLLGLELGACSSSTYRACASCSVASVTIRRRRTSTVTIGNPSERALATAPAVIDLTSSDTAATVTASCRSPA